MKSKKMKIAFTAMVAILLTLIAVPLVTASTTNANTTILTYIPNLQAKLLPPLPEYDDSLPGFRWDPSTGSVTTGIIDFNLANLATDGFSGTLSPSDGRNIAFGLNLATLIEYNDTGTIKGVYDPEDTIIQEIVLSELTWGSFKLTVVPGIELMLSVSGTHPSGLKVTVTMHLYVNSAVITVPPNGTSGIDTTLPGKAAVKLDIKIENFPWSTPPGEALALCVVLDEEAKEDSEEHMFRVGGTIIDSSDNYAGVVVQLNPNESEIYIVTPGGMIHGVFNWFNYAVKGDAIVPVNSSYKVNGTDGLYLYLCVDYFGGDTLEFDPYLALAQGQVNLTPLLLVTSYFTSSQTTQLLFYGIIGALLVVGIVVAAVVYVRRR
ncbi:MAG: hypothetical protein QXR19_17765 [Candidatus Jordarchaeaceae archaeon]